MWQNSKHIMSLQDNQAHLWKLDVDDFKITVDSFWELLSEKEQLRAQKFLFELDRSMYVVGRGAMRKLLGYYLKKDPKKINLSYNKQGKPMVESDDNLKFNLSHSNGKIILGFSIKNDIGVDVEFNKRPIDIETISKKFFSKTECKNLLKVDTTYRQKAFYNCWTRKEAFIKAKGGGLSIPLDQFEVTLSPEEKPFLTKINWDEGDVTNWNMDAFECGEEYTGAVIVNQKVTDYFYFEFKNKNLQAIALNDSINHKAQKGIR